ncbi:MAG: hypothetical protein LAO18_01570 [Acidobacteriia bacterium]|jgi:hypothetical protein|nr:hypothetical protein [Terriglobia bacterium]
MKRLCIYICIVAAFATSALAGVTVSSPGIGVKVSSPVSFVASASAATCSRGVASMGVYVDDVLSYVVNGTSLNTKLSLNPGSHKTVVQEWDYCGGSTFSVIPLTVTAETGVFVTSPVNNSTVGSPVRFTATAATSTCAKGVASMGIYTAPSPDKRVYVTKGDSLNTTLSLSPGTYNTVVQEWDYCGGAAFTPVTIKVSGNTLTNLQARDGWRGWGELAPAYEVCTDCQPEVTWSMTQTGGATTFDIGGTKPYSDVLWSYPVVGPASVLNLPDKNKTLVPSLKNFIYDAYFFSSTIAASQVLEFDVSQYFGGKSFIYGSQCRIAGGHEWDIWDNVNRHWVSAGIACNPVNNDWNHVVVRFQRTSDNQVLYQSITLNGVTHDINRTFAPYSAPSDWYGITVKFQMDGNYKQTPYSVKVDKLNFTYW